jgi:hypothetical protein
MARLKNPTIAWRYGEMDEVISYQQHNIHTIYVKNLRVPPPPPSPYQIPFHVFVLTPSQHLGLSTPGTRDCCGL